MWKIKEEENQTYGKSMGSTGVKVNLVLAEGESQFMRLMNRGYSGLLIEALLKVAIYTMMRDTYEYR